LEDKAFPVEDDLRDEPRVVRSDFLSQRIAESQPGDKLKRSLLRHDPEKAAKAIWEVINQ
jgi:small ligand-binding sensory domain FIST